jgi:hypothetical protein
MKMDSYPLFAAAVLAALLYAPPTQARPRDDAMAGAFRCAVIGNARVWLDCYYGAAQPVRAQLGMAPAPASQIKLALAPPSGGAMQDNAVRDNVMADAAGCIRMVSDRQWLNCYYGATQPMRAQLGLSALPQAPGAPARPMIARAAPATTVTTGTPPMPRSHGLLTGLFNDPAPIVRRVPAKSYSFDHNGAFTVVLADGQVWKQSAEDAVHHPANWRGPAPDLLVSVSPGAMNTFNLSVEGNDRYYKARRVR